MLNLKLWRSKVATAKDLSGNSPIGFRVETHIDHEEGGGGSGGGASVTATAASPTLTEGSTTNNISADLHGATRVLNMDASGNVIDSSTPAAVYPYAASPVSGTTASMTGTASVAVTGIGAVAAKYNFITQISVSNTDADTDTSIELQDGSGGTSFYTIPAPRGGAVISFPVPLKQPTANTALFAKNTVTGATVVLSASGYQSA